MHIEDTHTQAKNINHISQLEFHGSTVENGTTGESFIVKQRSAMQREKKCNIIDISSDNNKRGKMKCYAQPKSTRFTVWQVV